MVISVIGRFTYNTTYTLESGAQTNQCGLLLPQGKKVPILTLTKYLSNVTFVLFVLFFSVYTLYVDSH